MISIPYKNLFRLTHTKALLLISLLVVLVYANMLHNPMIWDDLEMVQNNNFIHSLSNIKHIFTTSAFGGQFDTNKFYRPLQISTYIFDYSIWGLTPFGYHLTSLLIHLFSCFLLYVLALKFKYSSRLALMMTLLFSIHPLHIESVTYISGRGDALNLLFALATVLAFIKGLENKKSCLIATIPLFWGGVLSKENIIILPFILLSYYLFIFKGKRQISHKLTLFVLTISSCLFALWRLNPFHKSIHQPLSLISNASFLERIYTFPKILVTYFKLLVFPYPLHMEYHFVETHFWSIYMWLWTPIMAIIIYILSRYVDSKKTLFYLSWFFIGMIPISNVLCTLASTIREHWMYIPSVGLFLFVFEAGSNIYQKNSNYVKISICILFFSTLILFSILTSIRNEQWGDPLKFYIHDLTYEPKSFVMENNLGAYYFLDMNNQKKATIHFKRSVQVSPNKEYSVALNNYGYMMELEGNLSLAATYYQRSIDATRYILGYSNLSRLYISSGSYEKALPLLNDGLIHYPNNFQLMLMKGHVLMTLNQREKLLALIAALEKINPNHRGVVALKREMMKY